MTRAAHQHSYDVERIRFAPDSPPPDGRWSIRSGLFWYAVAQGCWVIRTDQGTRRLKAGSLGLVPPGRRYRHGIAGPEPVEVIVLRVGSRAVSPAQLVDKQAWRIQRAVIAATHAKGCRLQVGRERRGRIHDHLQQMADIDTEPHELREIDLKAHYLQILAIIATEPNLAGHLDETHDLTKVPINGIKAVLEHIDEHLGEPLTVEQAAAIADLGRTRFLTAFKASTGMRFTQYLTRLRIQQAATELRTTSKTVLDIAFDAGFNSISRFYEAFKQEIGVAPARYRRDAS